MIMEWKFTVKKKADKIWRYIGKEFENILSEQDYHAISVC